jgi:hypothetical protein
LKSNDLIFIFKTYKILRRFVKQMSKLIILPEVEDILLFTNPNYAREMNDKFNKIRENIILNMNNIDSEFLEEQKYGDGWKFVKNKFEAALTKMTTEQYDKYIVKHMGGMNYNYDFIIQFISNDKMVEERKVEFKFNNSRLNDLPQFLELYDKNVKQQYNLCDVSYAEFYYENYLDKYLDIDKNITESKPPKDIYLKNVSDIKYKHSFFKNMHENKNNFIKEKRELATLSIVEYLKKYSNTFDFNKLTEKIKTSQDQKIFLLWDCLDFHVQQIEVEKMNITKIIDKDINKMYFDVEVEQFIYNIRIRINWGNSGGLCNPRWKFTFIYK